MSSNESAIFIIALVVGFIIGGLTGGFSAEIQWKDTFAKTECARYNPDTAEFEILK